MFNQYLIALDQRGSLPGGPYLYLSTNEFKPWKRFENQDFRLFDKYEEALDCVDNLKKIWPDVSFVIRKPKLKEEDLETKTVTLVTDHSLSNIKHLTRLH